MIFCTGAVSDIERATKIARSMIVDYGMSEKLGPIAFGSGEDDVFLGRDLMKSKNYSEEVASSIDQEVKKIIDDSYERAKKIISDFHDKAELVASTLMEKKRSAVKNSCDYSKQGHLISWGRITDCRTILILRNKRKFHDWFD
jgi:ATP-dependent Zn protease